VLVCAADGSDRTHAADGEQVKSRLLEDVADRHRRLRLSLGVTFGLLFDEPDHRQRNDYH
jgi:hypothetical protein